MEQQNEKQRTNKPSILLSQDENDLVFSLLGRGCQSMSTGVVQLYTTDAPAHSAWHKRMSGIACFVRDSSKRSYFIRVYCMAKHELVWEEEMYDSIIVSKPREFLISFEGLECMVALSFASDAEANIFYKTVTAKIASRSKKRRSRKFSPTKTDGAQDAEYDSGVVLRNKNPTEVLELTQMSQTNTPFESRRDKKRPNRKLTKADISNPTGFKHVVHVGLNDSKGFDLNTDDVNCLDSFLKKAGVSEQHLSNRESRAYIYDFIQSQNVLDVIKSEMKQQRSSPLQTINQNTTQWYVPRQQSRNVPPGCPPPISDPHIQQSQMATTVHIPAPPPPPPPPPLSTLPSFANQSPTSYAPPAPTPTAAPVSQAPPPADGHNALMESIKKGTTLHKVDPATLNKGSGSGDTHDDLLREIRLGKQLKPAAERELTGQRDSCNRGTDALADALRRALQERFKAYKSSDEDESTSDNDEWDD